MEPSVEYRVSQDISKIVKSSSFSYPSIGEFALESIAELLEDKLLLTLVIKEGIPYKLFEIIQDHTPFTDADWATFLGLSTKSLQRYKRDDTPFKSLQTEKILEVMEVCHLALDVFGDRAKFKLWLHTPTLALGSHTPISLLSDSYGKDLVMTELVRIDHGIFV